LALKLGLGLGERRANKEFVGLGLKVELEELARGVKLELELGGTTSSGTST
jgi:hypothetical protein